MIVSFGDRATEDLFHARPTSRARRFPRNVVAAALVKAGLVDELALFSGGALIGSEGQSALGPLSLAMLADAQRPTLRSVTALGGDTCSRWVFRDVP